MALDASRGGGAAGSLGGAVGTGLEGSGAVTTALSCTWHPWSIGFPLSAWSPQSIAPQGALGFLVGVSEDIRPTLVFWVGIAIAIVYLILAIWIALAHDDRGVKRRLVGTLGFTGLVMFLGGSQYWLGALIALAFIVVSLVIAYVRR